MKRDRKITVSLTVDQARALQWFARHVSFEDALRSAPPHLGKEICTERAYGIVHAFGVVEEQLRTAGQHGDAWMYAAPDEPTGPTEPQIRALDAWRSAMGVTWKAKLLAAWERAGAGYAAYTPELQQLRNKFGPSWLARYRIPPQTRTEAPMISGEAFK